MALVVRRGQLASAAAAAACGVWDRAHAPMPGARSRNAGRSAVKVVPHTGNISGGLSCCPRRHSPRPAAWSPRRQQLQPDRTAPSGPCTPRPWPCGAHAHAIAQLDVEQARSSGVHCLRPASKRLHPHASIYLEARTTRPVAAALAVRIARAIVSAGSVTRGRGDQGRGAVRGEGAALSCELL
jgi:hypothetical protein